MLFCCAWTARSPPEEFHRVAGQRRRDHIDHAPPPIAPEALRAATSQVPPNWLPPETFARAKFRRAKCRRALFCRAKISPALLRRVKCRPLRPSNSLRHKPPPCSPPSLLYRRRSHISITPASTAGEVELDKADSSSPPPRNRGRHDLLLCRNTSRSASSENARRRSRHLNPSRRAHLAPDVSAPAVSAPAQATPEASAPAPSLPASRPSSDTAAREVTRDISPPRRAHSSSPVATNPVKTWALFLSLPVKTAQEFFSTEDFNHNSRKPAQLRLPNLRTQGLCGTSLEERLSGSSPAKDPHSQGRTGQACL